MLSLLLSKVTLSFPHHPRTHCYGINVCSLCVFEDPIIVSPSPRLHLPTIGQASFGRLTPSGSQPSQITVRSSSTLYVRSLKSVSFYDHLAAQKRPRWLLFEPRHVTEFQGGPGSWARGTWARAPVPPRVHLPDRSTWQRACAAAVPVARVRGHSRSGRRTLSPAVRSLSSSVSAAATPVPAPRLTVQTQKLNSSPTTVRSAYSLTLPTGDPPAVKHGASCCKALTTARARARRRLGGAAASEGRARAALSGRHHPGVQRGGGEAAAMLR